MIKAIIFDFDDTLEDWTYARVGFHKKFDKKITDLYDLDIKLFHKTYREIESDLIMNRNGVKKFDRAMWFRKTLRTLKVKYTNEQIDDLLKFYWDESFKAVKLFPGVKKMILDLKKQGYKLAILTDSDGGRDIKIRRIKKFELAKEFDLITTGEDVHASKPDPKCFRYVLKHLNVKPNEAIMVGDNPRKDLKGAKFIGMKTVWVKQGFWQKTVTKEERRYADHTIKKIKDLPKILVKLN